MLAFVDDVIDNSYISSMIRTKGVMMQDSHQDTSRVI